MLSRYKVVARWKISRIVKSKENRKDTRGFDRTLGKDDSFSHDVFDVVTRVRVTRLSSTISCGTSSRVALLQSRLSGKRVLAHRPERSAARDNPRPTNTLPAQAANTFNDD